MIKILYIVSTLEKGGPTTQLFNIIKYMDREKHELHLITLSPEPQNSSWAEYESLGVHLHSLKLSRLQGVLCATRKVKFLLAKIKPDIIHTHLLRADMVLSKLKKSTRNITTVHIFPRDYISSCGRMVGYMMYACHVSAIRKIGLCVGVSDAVAGELKNKLKIENVIAIQNGVDTEKYFPSTGSEKKSLRNQLKLPIAGNIFICSGTLTKRKNPFFIINAWKKKFALDNDNHLVFIGMGNLHGKCVEETKGCNNIHVIGYVDNVVDYLRASDYCVSASYCEGLPYAVLEAMACGLPVLLSDIEPHKEITVLDSRIGFCYELDNEENFYHLLDKLINCNIEDMVKITLRVIKKYFSAKKMSEAYQREYKNIFYCGEETKKVC